MNKNGKRLYTKIENIPDEHNENEEVKILDESKIKSDDLSKEIHDELSDDKSDYTDESSEIITIEDSVRDMMFTLYIRIMKGNLREGFEQNVKESVENCVSNFHLALRDPFNEPFDDSYEAILNSSREHHFKCNVILNIYVRNIVTRIKEMPEYNSETDIQDNLYLEDLQDEFTIIKTRSDNEIIQLEKFKIF